MTESIPQSYFNLIEQDKNHRCPPEMEHFCVNIVSVAKLPSQFGNFFAIGYQQTADDKEHAAFVKGDIVNKKNVLVRLHSECLTGDAIGSLRCDCRDQLKGALMKIEEEGEGILLYLRQEGRGIGLTNKLKAYALQDQGLNTVEANLALGFKDDQRDYHLAGHMLKSLGVKSIRLLTNNPKKILALQKWGIQILERVEHIYPENPYNKRYLKTKMEVSSHLLAPNMNAGQYLQHQSL
ncbi:MAG: GTP cyclohydrolase II [Candidatus Hodarchaeota archaeon]